LSQRERKPIDFLPPLDLGVIKKKKKKKKNKIWPATATFFSRPPGRKEGKEKKIMAPTWDGINLSVFFSAGKNREGRGKTT